ncbi:MAG TPA: hypothetical protein VG755_28210 [Nannocystaceae bacterium]|nr:hypothetical protein [Nannocystaceae bacterium]
MVCALHLAAHPADAIAAAPAPSGETRTFTQSEPACTLLELEGDVPREAVRVSAAIGRALARRDLDDGRRASLAELRLAMGCDGDAPACLARGGKSLGSQRVLYGSVVREGQRYNVRLNLLDVASASVIRSSATPIEATALTGDSIDATADALVASLFPLSPEPAASTPAAAPDPVAPPTTPVADAPAKRSRALEWGREQPPKRWKIAMLATSASLGLVFLGSAIGLTVANKVTLRRKLIEAVDASQTDSNPNNDIDRTEPDFCAAARETPPGEPNPQKVTNANVTQICNRGDGVSKASIGMWVATGIAVAATAAFTVLLFVRRADARPRTARRVSPFFDAAPGRAQLGIVGRF